MRRQAAVDQITTFRFIPHAVERREKEIAFAQVVAQEQILIRGLFVEQRNHASRQIGAVKLYLLQPCGTDRKSNETERHADRITVGFNRVFDVSCVTSAHGRRDRNPALAAAGDHELVAPL